MKALLPLVALLILRPCVAQKTQSATALPSTQSDQTQAHDSVMKFLQGTRIAALSEGKQLLAETQWIVGQADRGQNYYSRPDYTEVTSLYATLFDADVPSVRGYKELFDMKAVTKAGTTRNVKYLVIAFKDIATDKWKILSTLDNVDGESSLDVDHQIEFFKGHLPDTSITSAMDNYATYGEWLLRGGHIREAQSALETAKNSSPTSGLSQTLKQSGDPVRALQIETLLTIISKLIPH